MKFKAVFFDFDYTLGDGTEAIVAGFRYAFEKLGLPEPDREAVRRTIGMMLEDEYTLLSGDADPAGRAEFRRLYTEKAGPLQVETTRLFPGAAKLLGLETVPCIIVDVDEKKSAELAIIENIQRENLNIFEQASSIASLIDIYNLTQEDAARQLSMSQSFVANKLRILRLTQPERDKILEYNLTERHARALLKVDSVEQRLRIIEYINSHSLNVATTEAYIDRMLAESGRKSNPRSPKRIILKDIRLFYNSLDKAVSLVRQAGIDIRTERTESDSNIDIVITIPKSPK